LSKTCSSQGLCEGRRMNSRINPAIDRRDLLRGLTIATIASAATAAPLAQARADTENSTERRKARYQANSPEVQTFYRVNRYPPA
jgi:hypothetical protein